MTTSYSILLIALFCLGCQQDPRVDQHAVKLSGLEEEVDSLKRVVKSIGPQGVAQSYLRAKGEANVRSSPSTTSDNNVIGQLFEDDVVKRLGGNEKWHNIRVYVKGTIFEGHASTSLFESVSLTESAFLEKAKYNNFRLRLSPSILKVFRRQRNSLVDHESIGLVIHSLVPLEPDLEGIITDFFVNIDPVGFKIRPLESRTSQSDYTLACIVEVVIVSSLRHELRISDKTGAILFHDFVNFRFVD